MILNSPDRACSLAKQSSLTASAIEMALPTLMRIRRDWILIWTLWGEEIVRRKMARSVITRSAGDKGRQSTASSLARTNFCFFDDHPAVETFSLDHISPVIERLQRLEGKVDELGSKPPEIPLEKERSLLESWDRIKCIESDLERTKKVLQATVMKQLKIAESIEEVIWSKLRRRRFCA